MFGKRILATAALIGLTATPVLAQTASPASPSRPGATAPSTTSPAVPSLSPGAMAPSTPAVTSAGPQTSRPTMGTSLAAMPAATPINLNTATAQQIDALPDIGAARTKAILAERAKGKFKDWADFEKRMTGTSVNAGVQGKIKDRVTF